MLKNYSNTDNALIRATKIKKIKYVVMGIQKILKHKVKPLSYTKTEKMSDLLELNQLDQNITRELIHTAACYCN